LYPIIEEDNLPKALLPVANKPLISYTLDWLEKAGITGQFCNVFDGTHAVVLGFNRELPPDAIVLTQAMGNAQQKIAGYLARGYQGNVHCNLIAVDEDFGTADAIRSISDRITVRHLE
jgi:translation initiation factor eIF-2B subunit gamma